MAWRRRMRSDRPSDNVSAFHRLLARAARQLDVGAGTDLPAQVGAN